MSEIEPPGGRGRFFGRRRRREDPEERERNDPDQPGFDDWLAAPRPIETRPSAAEDPEARARREAEAETIQLAREAAIANALRALEEDRWAADQEARDAALAKLTLWTDSHCHIQYAPDDAEAANIVQRAAEAGTRRMISVGTDVASSRRAIDLAGRLSRGGTLSVDVFATVGLHPHDAASGVDPIRTLLSDLKLGIGDGSRVVAVGECGLDYHYDHAPRTTQRKVFAAQVALANQYDLALVIHTREAFDDTLAILDAEGVPERTIFHCFTGGPAEAERCLAIGGYLSFSGILTFNNAGDVREAAKICPLDRLLIETDSPYLTPVPYRGKTNEPSYVSLVGEALRHEKVLSRVEIARVTSENAVTAFRLRVA
ncbi:MAG: TatD family hydrolase [Acidimicrobiales bacterium]